VSATWLGLDKGGTREGEARRYGVAARAAL